MGRQREAFQRDCKGSKGANTPRNRIVTTRVTEVTRDARRSLRVPAGSDDASNMPAVFFSSMPLALFLCQVSQVADGVVSTHVDASVQAGTAHEDAKHHEDCHRERYGC